MRSRTSARILEVCVTRGTTTEAQKRSVIANASQVLRLAMPTLVRSFVRAGALRNGGDRLNRIG